MKAVSAMVLTLDDAYYKTKPGRAEFGKITNRIKAARPREVSKGDFCSHVANGGSWVGGEFENDLKKLVRWQLSALDFDDGSFSPTDALDRCELLNITPMCVYFTLSATLDNPRFRLVFMLDQPLTDEKQARKCISALLGAFPEADQSCKNPNRIFLGSQGEVWPVYEVWQL